MYAYPKGAQLLSERSYRKWKTRKNTSTTNTTERVETIELPHEEYTTPADIKRINDELGEKGRNGELLPLRKTKNYLMFAEPSINGIWTLFLDAKGYIKKIVLF